MFPSANSLDARPNLPRWMLSAACPRDVDGAVARRRSSDKIEFHTESGLGTLVDKTAHSRAE